VKQVAVKKACQTPVTFEANLQMNYFDFEDNNNDFGAIQHFAQDGERYRTSTYEDVFTPTGLDKVHVITFFTNPTHHKGPAEQWGMELHSGCICPLFVYPIDHTCACEFMNSFIFVSALSPSLSPQ
jgi:hypothetical protein